MGIENVGADGGGLRDHVLSRDSSAEQAAEATPGDGFKSEDRDRVVTNGGIHGQVSNVKDGQTLVLKIADNVKIEVEKSAVATILKDSKESSPSA